MNNELAIEEVQSVLQNKLGTLVSVYNNAIQAKNDGDMSLMKKFFSAISNIALSDNPEFYLDLYGWSKQEIETIPEVNCYYNNCIDREITRLKNSIKELKERLGNR